MFIHYFGKFENKSRFRFSSKDVTVKEWHVVREIIWLLIRPSPGFVFTRRDDGYITMSSDAVVSSLSKVSSTS